MKTLIPCLAAVVATACAYASPGEDVKAAASKLAAAPNYAWTATTEMAGGGFGAGTLTGVTEKSGYTVISRDFNGTPFQSVRLGDKIVMQNRDGEWITREEMLQQFGGGGGGAGGANRGGGRFGMIETPAEVLTRIATQTKELKAEDGALAGDLDEKGAADLIGMGRGAKNASGSVKIWLKDGAVSKFEMHVKGTVAGRDGQEREVDRTLTTEIKDVGTTKVQVPDGAKKKLGT